MNSDYDQYFANKDAVETAPGGLRRNVRLRGQEEARPRRRMTGFSPGGAISIAYLNGIAPMTPSQNPKPVLPTGGLWLSVAEGSPIQNRAGEVWKYE